ncbi:large subunit ribosomal protein L35 [Methylohalomonas lacus]|uniref:Large ribosomal subunit protein bL35 n=1 Tax=Methylohalomonas lacus TaxID=398773 RepID=A0AAE3HJJ0_9GAMM|nr:50S ribosomal protein L35 [Methylohalomonas lacus]MCS3903544.1 large subunit ribosomal protein L35 [Methylohalomonas lacus]
MPKMKTVKSAAKRFKRTGGGGFKHRQSFRSHMSTHKPGKRMQHLRPLQMVDPVDVKSIEKMVPYI